MSYMYSSCSAASGRRAPSDTSSQPGDDSLQHTVPPVLLQYVAVSPSSANAGSAV
jgi:hypothetical protein